MARKLAPSNLAPLMTKSVSTGQPRIRAIISSAAASQHSASVSNSGQHVARARSAATGTLVFSRTKYSSLGQSLRTRSRILVSAGRYVRQQRTTQGDSLQTCSRNVHVDQSQNP
jgi:hypothetical protein